MDSLEQSREWAESLTTCLHFASEDYRYWDEFHDKAHMLGPEKFKEKYGYPMGVVCINHSIAQFKFINTQTISE